MYNIQSNRLAACQHTKKKVTLVNKKQLAKGTSDSNYTIRVTFSHS